MAETEEIGKVYEQDGAYYFKLAFNETGEVNTFGPYNDRDKAECDLSAADAMWN